LSVLLLATTSAWSEDEKEQQLQNRLKAHIDFLANDPERPSWLEGDFFGRTFAK